MTIRSYLWGMRTSTILALIGWLLVIFYVDPEKSGEIGRLLFYGSTFILCTGIFILFMSWVNGSSNTEDKGGVAEISASFRQGVLLSFLVVMLLFFQENRILIWWDGLLIVAGIFLIELYFLSHHKK